jgi:hypothetical protein
MSRIAHNRDASGEQLLWITVLRQALEDALPPERSMNDRRSRVMEEARRWILEYDRDFEVVCALAGAEPDWVRAGLRALIAGSPTAELSGYAEDSAHNATFNRDHQVVADDLN